MLSLSDQEFATIKEYVKKNYGINLSNDKKSLVYSRLRTTVAELGLDSFGDYYDLLSGDESGKTADEFINKISTNHTFFMREKEHFDFLAEKVLPEIEARSLENDMRIWCTACSSGEESYTLQILLQEYFKDKRWNTQMLASDVSKKVLGIAHNGVYSAESLQVMPKDWIKTYFEPYERDFYRTKDSVKKEILYRKINLMDENLDRMFTKKFHVIFCRNVMIYFDEATRDKLVSKFYNMIEPGGYLFIGHSERIDSVRVPFKFVMPAVYKKE